MAGWAAALAVFLTACVLAGTYDKFPGDLWLAQRIQTIDSEQIARLLNWAEDSADLVIVVVVCAVTAGALVLVRDALGALIFSVAVPGRVLTTWFLKELIERPRPSAEFLDFTSQPSTFSFPSGHAGGAFVVYGLIVYFAAIHIQHALARSVIQALCLLIIVGAGLERVYVGHHWPSDVLGGYWHGALIVSAAIAIHQLAPRVWFEVTSGRSLRLHVRRQSPEETLGRPRET